jgi:peptide/nickel transport system permease protein
VILRKLLSGVLTLWLAVTLAFFVLRVLPGDAIQAQLLQGGASEQQIAERRAQLGLDQPLLVQYAAYLIGLLRGDLGISLLNGEPVTYLILLRLQPTISLALAALVIASVVGIGLGVFAGLYGKITWVARLIIDLSVAIPVYWTGTLAVFLFTTSGGVAIPAVVLGFHAAGAIARVTANEIRQTWHFDFVRTAYAKGLHERTILLRHVLRAVLPPAITVIALQAGVLLSGTVITESLFLRAGIGKLLMERVLLQDYPVVQGVVILSAAAYTLLNIGANVLYVWLDPRLRFAE